MVGSGQLIEVSSSFEMPTWMSTGGGGGNCIRRSWFIGPYGTIRSVGFALGSLCRVPSLNESQCQQFSVGEVSELMVGSFLHTLTHSLFLRHHLLLHHICITIYIILL
jgi:hypothetical protein